MALRLNEPLIRVKAAVGLVEAIRIAMGKTIMPGDWVKLLADGEVERVLWQTDEQLRYRPTND